MYNDVLIERYDIEDHVKRGDAPQKDFDLIDGYKKMISPYIYTNIKLTDHTESIQKAFQSRLQEFISATLLRSIKLKNGAAQALNSINFPSYYAILKSFLEIPALMAYVAESLFDGKDEKEMCTIISKISMGTRTKENEIVMIPHRPDNQQVSILTMFEKLNKIMYEMDKISGVAGDKNSIASSYYSDICNFGHPNYPAHLCVGRIDKDGVWKAKDDNINYRNELFWFYMPHFSSAISIIYILCSQLVRHPKVKNFDMLNNPLYFDN
ncbi:MAG: hypothetical protein COU29_02830 [Candidatus Magasanikbacteria bacterium CG10_big_fil_rev_8_21_14_0_10_36_32]|uniref:Uncharacterized protein n=1 Tax=Candidatus Magasanikbacteria bacterium CG10_big_fil_rev_8_21_14_0_10_36_32 TaxID=1974646 RepID=A0A2M6W7F1_9BACT|nr:MAG: hypothetical protein COU29_02830 [Candidatus Magasanikbacteria bacterium CG10_big_fil_rev_8_21_14_0_10_36_32]